MKAESKGSACLEHKLEILIICICILLLAAATDQPIAGCEYPASPSHTNTIQLKEAQGTHAEAIQVNFSTLAPSLSSKGYSTVYITSNSSYNNINFTASNETIVVNSSISRPVSLSFFNSTAIFNNTNIEISHAVNNYGQFTMKFLDSRLIINRSMLNGNSSAPSPAAMIELNNSFASVHDSKLYATGPIIDSVNSSSILLRLSGFYGVGALIAVSICRDVVMTGDSFVSTPTPFIQANASHGTPFTVISVASSRSLIFSGNYLNDSGTQADSGLSATKSLHIRVENSIFGSDNATSNTSPKTSAAVFITDCNFTNIDSLRIAGGETGIVLYDGWLANVSRIVTTSDYAGIIADALIRGTISNVSSIGGIFTIILQNSTNVSLVGDSAFGSLFGIRIVFSSGILLDKIYERNVISAVQFVKCRQSALYDAFVELIPDEFNFAEFYGLTIAGSSGITINGVRMVNAPGLNGGFIDGCSVLFTNDSAISNLHMFFSGGFVSTAVYIFRAFGNTVDSTTVASDGTYGDAGMVLIDSGSNAISNATVNLIGTQALLLQYSSNNTFRASSWSVYGTEPHGIYLYWSNHNHFVYTAVVSNGIYSETGIVFNAAQGNIFNVTNVQLTGSFQSALLVQSIQSRNNVFNGFTFFSDATNLYWLSVSFLIALASTTGVFISAHPKRVKPFSKEDEKRLKRYKL